MTAIVDTREQAAALDLPPLLVRRPLDTFLDAHALGEGPLEAEPIGEGLGRHVHDPARRRAWVLRRPPLPPNRAARGAAARGVLFVDTTPCCAALSTFRTHTVHFVDSTAGRTALSTKCTPAALPRRR